MPPLQLLVLFGCQPAANVLRAVHCGGTGGTGTGAGAGWGLGLVGGWGVMFLCATLMTEKLLFFGVPFSCHICGYVFVCRACPRFGYCFVCNSHDIDLVICLRATLMT